MGRPRLAHAELAAQSGHKVDGVRPTVECASVSGTALTVTFDETLGAAASLANGAFKVKKTQQGGTEAEVSLSATGPAVSGATVVLTLASAVVATDTAIKVGYTKPTTSSDNKLVDAVGNTAENFADRAVTNTAPPSVSSDPGGDAAYLQSADRLKTRMNRPQGRWAPRGSLHQTAETFRRRIGAAA